MLNESDNRGSFPASDMESNIGNDPNAKKKTPRFNSPVNVRVISYRKRNHDTDGVSIKAILDGIVRRGILIDDSSKEVKSINFESKICKKGQEEKTIVVITDETI